MSSQPSVPPGPAGPGAGLVEAVARRLRERGERMTVPRRAVLEILAGREAHLGAEEIVAAVAQAVPGVHRASVYRTLDALSELGVVQHVHVGHGATAYHLVLDDGAHLHSQCRSCGRVRDLPSDLLAQVAQDLRQHYGFVLDPGHVALSGQCADCAGRAAGGPG